MPAFPPLSAVTGSVPCLVNRLGLRPPVLPAVLNRELALLMKPLASLPAVRAAVSRLVINYYAHATPLRPRARSMVTDYTSWLSLTDRNFTGRHLPPAEPQQMSNLSSESEATALYRREQERTSTGHAHGAGLGWSPRSVYGVWAHGYLGDERRQIPVCVSCSSRSGLRMSALWGSAGGSSTLH
jgi:hypothetical protein